MRCVVHKEQQRVSTCTPLHRKLQSQKLKKEREREGRIGKSKGMIMGIEVGRYENLAVFNACISFLLFVVTIIFIARLIFPLLS